MAAGTIGTATVEVRADTSKLNLDLSKQIQQSFAAAQRQIDQSLSKMVASTKQGFQNLQKASAATKIDSPKVDLTGLHSDLARAEAVVNASKPHLPAVDTSSFTHSISDAAHEAQGGVSRIQQAFAGIRSIALETVSEMGSNIVLGITQQIKQFVTLGITSAAALEQVQIGFEGVLGSAGAATDMIKTLQDFAAKTPFEFEGLATAAQRLLAAGFKSSELIPILTKIGDAAASVGAPAEAITDVIRSISRIGAAGRATLGDFELITNALPNFKVFDALAAHMGITVPEVFDKMSKGGIDAKTVIDGIFEGLTKVPGALGAMERQATTLLGLFSTFKDTVKQQLVGAFQPLIPALKQNLDQATPVVAGALSKLAPALSSVATTILPQVLKLVSQFAGPVADVITGIGDAVKLTTPEFEPFIQAIADIVSAGSQLIPVLAQIVGAFVEHLTPVIEALIEPIKAFATGFGKLGGEIEGFNGIIAVLVANLLGLGPAAHILLVFSSSLPALGARLGELITKFFDFVEANKEFLPAINTMLSALAAMSAVNHALHPASLALVELAKAGGTFSGSAGKLSKALGILRFAGPAAIIAGGGIALLAKHSDAVRDALDSLIPTLQKAGKQIGDSLGKAIEENRPAIEKLAQSIVILVQTALPALIEAFAKLVPIVVTLLSTGLKLLAPIIKVIADNALIAVPALVAMAAALVAFKTASAVAELVRLSAGISTLAGVADPSKLQKLAAGFSNIASSISAEGGIGASMKGLAGTAAAAVGGMGPLVLIVGSLAAAAVAAGIAFKIWSDQRREQAALEKSYAEALKDTNRAVEDSVDAGTAAELQRKHQLDDLQDIGVRQETYSAAVRGSVEATNTFRKAIAASEGFTIRQRDATGQTTDVTKQMTAEWIKGGSRALAYGQSIATSSDELNGLVASFDKDVAAARKAAISELELAAAHDTAAGALARRALAQADNQKGNFDFTTSLQNVRTALANEEGGAGLAAEQVGNLTSKFDEGKSAADAYRQAMDQVSGANLGVVEAQNALADAQTAVNKALLENGATLDRSTEAGNANEDVILRMVDAQKAANSAQLEVDKNVQAATDRQLLYREGLIQTVQQFGKSRPEAEAYVNTLVGTPEEIKTKMSLVGDQVNIERVKDLTARLKTLDGEEVHPQIKALIDQGKLDEADKALNDIAAQREAEIKATPTNIAPAKVLLDSTAAPRPGFINAEARDVPKTKKELDDVAADRTVKYHPEVDPTSEKQFSQKINDLARDRHITISASLPPKAKGGPVVAGGVYQVGERGPELFVPTSSGVVIPAGVTKQLIRMARESQTPITGLATGAGKVAVGGNTTITIPISVTVNAGTTQDGSLLGIRVAGELAPRLKSAVLAAVRANA